MTRSDIADYLGVGEPNNQAVFGMKLTPKNDRFQGDALAPDESKFEKPEIVPGNAGVRAFWSEAAKNLPFAVQQFQAGNCPHPPTEDPSKARQAARCWRRVRDWEDRKHIPTLTTG